MPLIARLPALTPGLSGLKPALTGSTTCKALQNFDSGQQTQLWAAGFKSGSKPIVRKIAFISSIYVSLYVRPSFHFDKNIRFLSKVFFACLIGLGKHFYFMNVAFTLFETRRYGTQIAAIITALIILLAVSRLNIGRLVRNCFMPKFATTT